MSKPCERCGGSKAPGRGHHYCEPCAVAAKAEADERTREYRCTEDVREYERRQSERCRRARGVPTHEEAMAALVEPVVCGRRICKACGRWRPVSDFEATTLGPIGLTASCATCRRIRQRRYAAARRDDPKRAELRREYERIWRESQRRKQGIAPRPLTRQAPPDLPYSHNGNGYMHRRLPAEPLAEQLRAWTRTQHAASSSKGFYQDRGITRLAAEATVSERRVSSILHGEYEQVHVAVADRLLVAMGLTLKLVYPDA